MVLSIVNISQAMDNPFAPLFTEKRVLKLAVSWSILDYKQPKTRSRSSTWRPSTADAKYQLLKLGHAQNEKSRDTAVSTFTFRLSLPCLPCLSLAIFFFNRQKTILQLWT